MFQSFDFNLEKNIIIRLKEMQRILGGKEKGLERPIMPKMPSAECDSTCSQVCASSCVTNCNRGCGNVINL